MTPISRKILRAIEAIVYIALYHGAQPVNGKKLADKQGLPPRYLERVLQKLVHEGILRSVRGPRGGYVLAKERRRISIGEIYRVVLESDDEIDSTRLTPIGELIIQPVCMDATNTLLEHLDTITIAQMCEKAYAGGHVQSHLEGRVRAAGARQDFAI